MQEAEAGKVAAEREAEGRKAVAQARQMELVAEAKGEQAQLEAEAAGVRAKLTAEAEGIQAKLEAEAEGVRKKAEAYRQLDQAGKLLLILEHLPEILRATGDAVHQAGLGTVAPMAQAIGTGMSGIEEVRIVDLGGGAQAQDGKDALSRFMGGIPKTTFELLQQIRGLGLESVFAQLSEKLGVDLTTILRDIATPTSADTAPDVEVAAMEPETVEPDTTTES